jgi:hypothetical protein
LRPVDEVIDGIPCRGFLRSCLVACGLGGARRGRQARGDCRRGQNGDGDTGIRGSNMSSIGHVIFFLFSKQCMKGIAQTALPAVRATDVWRLCPDRKDAFRNTGRISIS